MGITGKKILMTGLKVVGSAALGTVGVVSHAFRSAVYATGHEEAADFIGSIEDGSLNAIRDMWTPEDERTDQYYEDMDEKSERRRASAEREGERFRKEYEEAKNKRREDSE